ncbi:lysophospholipid acyltransferase family protein [Hyalangium rubrum]|uniref:Lysophospholipid acyltransferase family protein n=1 Tax=Hyalangium rubrum TaxID=3103134 RepID=A0ABU5H523_9BACT|nr:lysophospholipid acyltransferase family protein [Hyalangium sp. s54d21]MDY7228346.1 lysophospholipid acyltransferase family protein [Hyalangium sp. s54d21]
MVAALVTAGLMTVSSVAYPFSKQGAYHLRKVWGRALLRIFGVRLRVEDRNRGAYERPPYLFVLMNQTSLLEAISISAVAPVPMNAFLNIEFGLIPFLGWGVWLQGGVMVVRQWAAQAKRAAHKANQLLQRGNSFAISIEGRRSPTGALLPYKKGPVIMALTTGARIVPLYMVDARRLWPYGEWRVRPGELTAVLGTPVSLEGRALEERDIIVAELEALARAELSRQGYSGVAPPHPEGR